MPTQTGYGDISPRTAAYAAKDMLERGIPYLVFEKFGQGKPLPTRSSKVQTFRRYEALANTPAALTEGVTPTGKQLTVTDIPVTLGQYGDLVSITDVIEDTHEDPVLMEAIEVLGEQAAQMIEIVRYNALKAGTNVQYANGVARNAVNTPISDALMRKTTRTLKNQNARRITKIIRSTPNYQTENVSPGYVAICHPDCEGDIRALANFVPAEKYGSMSPYEGEVGKNNDIRYILTTICAPFADAGGAAGSMISTTGTNADVYPVLVFGENAYGIVPLKGKAAITPMVVNPKPSESDPLGQRGHASWKCYQACVILNDLWMVRCEVAVTD